MTFKDGPCPAAKAKPGLAPRRNCCWHAVGELVDGLGNGVQTARCCFCGGERTQRWTLSQDPAHGPHVQTERRQWAEPSVDR